MHWNPEHLLARATSGLLGNAAELHSSSPCVAATFSPGKELLAEGFGTDPDDWIPPYNSAPTQSVPVVRQHPAEPKRLAPTAVAELDQIHFELRNEPHALARDRFAQHIKRSYMFEVK